MANVGRPRTLECLLSQDAAAGLCLPVKQSWNKPMQSLVPDHLELDCEENWTWWPGPLRAESLGSPRAKVAQGGCSGCLITSPGSELNVGCFRKWPRVCVFELESVESHSGIVVVWGHFGGHSPKHKCGWGLLIPHSGMHFFLVFSRYLGCQTWFSKMAFYGVDLENRHFSEEGFCGFPFPAVTLAFCRRVDFKLTEEGSQTPTGFFYSILYPGMAVAPSSFCVFLGSLLPWK